MATTDCRGKPWGHVELLAGANVTVNQQGNEVTIASTGGAEGPMGPEGPQGPQGETGQQGPAGTDGADGVGVPVGGTTGQVLTKASNADHDTNWSTPAADGQAFPVGSVFIAVVATNPGTLLGYGTWSAFAAGRVLVGFNGADPDFDTAEETGGAKTHTLTTAEMPAHTHVQDAHTHVQNAHSHVITSQTATTGTATSYEHGVLDTSSAEAEATETTNPATATNQNATATNQNTGGGAAHNNMPPFVVVHLWKRTA